MTFSPDEPDLPSSHVHSTTTPTPRGPGPWSRRRARLVGSVWGARLDRIGEHLSAEGRRIRHATARPLTRAERVTLAVVLLAPVLFNAVALLPELTIPVPNFNDHMLHWLFIQNASGALASGQNVFDHWLPQVEMGLAQFFYYQHLPHLAVVLLERVSLGTIDLLTSFNVIRYVLLVTFPLTVFWSMRRMGFSGVAATIGGAASSLLVTEPGYGFDYESYTWRGLGVYTQLWAMHLSFITLACMYRLQQTGRGVMWAVLAFSLLVLSHLIYAYMMAITVAVLFLVGLNRANFVPRVVRFGIVAVFSGLIASYMVIPFALESEHLNATPYLEPEKYDSYGIVRILGWLIRGDLLDDTRPAILTALFGVGIVGALLGRVRAALLAVALLVVWLVIYAGRPTLGPVADLVPLARGLLFHRFVGGVHLAAILLIGVGGAVVWQLFAAHRARWRALAAGVAVLALFVPVFIERATFYDLNEQGMRESVAALEADADAKTMLDAIATLPPGRVYAGLRDDWGEQMSFGDVTFYNVLPFNAIEALAPPSRSLSLNGDLIRDFDDTDRSHYELFNVRYVLAPSGVPLPDFLRVIRETPRYTLYEAPSGGYAMYGSVVARQAFVDQRDLFYNNRAWFQGRLLPQNRQFIRYDYPSRVTEPLANRAECPDGEVSFELFQRGRVDLVVGCPTDSTLIIKTTYHPNWRVSVDGVNAQPYMVSPSLLAVDLAAGRHSVTAEYLPSPLKLPLLLIGLAALLSALIAGPRLDDFTAAVVAVIAGRVRAPTFGGRVRAPAFPGRVARPARLPAWLPVGPRRAPEDRRAPERHGLADLDDSLAIAPLTESTLIESTLAQPTLAPPTLPPPTGGQPPLAQPTPGSPPLAPLADRAARSSPLSTGLRAVTAGRLLSGVRVVSTSAREALTRRRRAAREGAESVAAVRQPSAPGVSGVRRGVLADAGRAQPVAVAALVTIALYALVYLAQRAINLDGSESSLNPKSTAQVAGELRLYYLVTFALFAVYAGIVVFVWRLRPIRGLARTLLLVTPVMIQIGLMIDRPYFSTDVLSYLAHGYVGTARGAGNAYDELARGVLGTNVGDTLAALGWRPPPIPSPYGPLWTNIEEVVMAITTRVPLAILIFKLLATLASLGSIALVWKILGHVRPNAQLLGTVLFAWNPVVIVELAGEGHNDALMLFLALVGILATVRTRPAVTLVAITFGILTKYVPALLLPPQLVYLWRTRTDTRSLLRTLALGGAASLIVTVVVFAPVWVGLQTFEGVRVSGEPGPWPTISGAVFRFIQRAAPAVDAGLVARVVVQGLFVAFLVVQSLRVRTLGGMLRAMGWISVAYLLLGSPIYFPWYAVLPIALLALSPGFAAVVMILLISLMSRAVAPLVDLRPEYYPFPIAAFQLTNAGILIGLFVFVVILMWAFLGWAARDDDPDQGDAGGGAGGGDERADVREAIRSFLRRFDRRIGLPAVARRHIGIPPVVDPVAAPPVDVLTPDEIAERTAPAPRSDRP